MTFGISRDHGEFEWSGTSPSSIFAMRSNLSSLRFWRMIFDIVRFNQFALDVLAVPPSQGEDQSVGDYLQQEGYSDAFRDDYLIPMTACVWSTEADKCALDFPILTLIRFLWNHHLLNTLAARPPWLTIPGGSNQYIDAVLSSCPNVTVHRSKPVRSLANDEEGRVMLIFDGAENIVYDRVILACHGDQAADIISDTASDLERELMQVFKTSENIAYLHSDTTLMPRRHVTWSSWNYLTKSDRSRQSHPPEFKANGKPNGATPVSSSGALSKVSLTYNMNILQHLAAPTPAPPFHSHPQDPSAPHILVTLNPDIPPAQNLTYARIPYRHPLYNADVIKSQDRLDEIQGVRGIYYCGAWTNYGFHEDGFRSGLGVALRPELGGSVGWQVQDAKFSRGDKPTYTWRDYLARIVILAVLIWIRLLERIGAVLDTLQGKNLQRSKLN